jgi:glycosyltransferase involved in cell wall biosynthesis
MSKAPLISVVMSVHNADKYVTEAIDSILSQSFPDFEFIIIDDGSTDKTSDILQHYASLDQRIKLSSQENTGLTVALNRGVQMSQGRYIARQDADDVSLPDRFKLQFDLLEKEPEVVVCGGVCLNVYESGVETRWRWEDQDTLCRSVFVKTPFAHSSAMFRNATVKDVGGYDASYKTAQDMDLWMRIVKAGGQLAMVESVVLKRRVLSSSVSAKKRWRQFYDALRARMHHNDTIGGKLYAIYYSLRILLINLMPIGLIQFIKRTGK